MTVDSDVPRAIWEDPYPTILLYFTSQKERKGKTEIM